jgi:DNA-binding CsgD family transcriptional regulator
MMAGVRLTAAEIEILKNYREGMHAQEIADKRHYSIHTVRHFARRIYRKLGVRNMHGALIEAMREGHIGLWD